MESIMMRWKWESCYDFHRTFGSKGSRVSGLFLWLSPIWSLKQQVNGRLRNRLPPLRVLIVWLVVLMNWVNSGPSILPFCPSPFFLDRYEESISPLQAQELEVGPWYDYF